MVLVMLTLLMEPGELNQLLSNPQREGIVRVLDARPKKQYDAGHIDGAVWVNHDLWNKTFTAKQDPKEWAKLIGQLAIPKHATVVIYDDARAKDAARIWWILRYWNTPDVRLLNGGWHGWTEAKLPVSKTASAPRSIAITLQKPLAPRLADKQRMLGLVKDKAQIVDARSAKEFCGDTKLAKKGGSIPGAINLEWTDTLDPKTQRFKTRNELRDLFKKAGIDLNKQVVTHCQSGGRSSVMDFALELAGARDVLNYYRGWSEWGNADDTPIHRP